MEDLFDKRDISPMLLHQSEPFDSDEYLFELKFDGARCIAYLDGHSTDLRDKRKKNITHTYPELKHIYKNVKKPCILDGEIILMRNGVPDFHALQKRSLLTDKFKIDIASKRHPISFVAYDILQIGKVNLTDVPLIERKKILTNNLIENERISYSRYIENEGIKFFQLAKSKNLEGVIAKIKTSKYHPGKRSKVWLKIKVWNEAYMVICGYIDTKNGGIRIVIGAYDNKGKLTDMGTLTGISRQERELIVSYAKSHKVKPHFNYKDEISWMKPKLVCKVIYMLKTDVGRMRQAIFKGLVTDVRAKDCKVISTQNNI